MGSSSRVGFLESLDSTVNTKVQEEAGELLRGGAGGHSPKLERLQSSARAIRKGYSLVTSVFELALYIYLIFMLFLRIFLILLLTL